MTHDPLQPFTIEASAAPPPAGCATAPNACCRDPGNLGPREQLSADIALRRCTVCGCRHFEAEADAGDLRLLGRGMGA